MRLQENSVEVSEQERHRIAAKFFRLGHRQNFNEEPGKLDDVIMRAPGMAVARADGEAHAAVQLGARVEIADGVGDVIEAVVHRIGNPIPNDMRLRSQPMHGRLTGFGPAIFRTEF
jgi:hypothetical protein